MCILSPMCSGQLFLVGHMSLNLSYPIRGSSHATTLYPWSFARALRQLFASAHALLTGAQDDISIITLHSSAFGVNPSLSWYLLLLLTNPSHCLPSILTPTELVPGACFACSATQPTHALTLSVPPSSSKRFPALSPSPLCCHPLQKGLWITGWHTEAPAGLSCFIIIFFLRWYSNQHLFFPLGLCIGAHYYYGTR